MTLARLRWRWAASSAPYSSSAPARGSSATTRKTNRHQRRRIKSSSRRRLILPVTPTFATAPRRGSPLPRVAGSFRWSSERWPRTHKTGRGRPPWYTPWRCRLPSLVLAPAPSPVGFPTSAELPALSRQIGQLVEQRPLLLFEFAIPRVEPVHLTRVALQPGLSCLLFAHDIVVVRRRRRRRIGLR